jgi:hypothetical protein
MHRLAEGDKGAFMSACQILPRPAWGPGATVDFHLHGRPGGRCVRQDDGGYYLHNSSFDPAAGSASPGIVARALIQRNRHGQRRFDLLKGTETYKRRFGARPRPLFAVEGVV